MFHQRAVEHRPSFQHSVADKGEQCPHSETMWHVTMTMLGAADQFSHGCLHNSPTSTMLWHKSHHRHHHCSVLLSTDSSLLPRPTLGSESSSLHRDKEIFCRWRMSIYSWFYILKHEGSDWECSCMAVWVFTTKQRGTHGIGDSFISVPTF